jgi:hypothetical protein
MAESPALAPSQRDWNDEFVASDVLISRLYRANEQTVLDLIARLTSHERAGLAAFCYRRSHLHSVGLTIAATCEQLTLIQVLGTAVGTVLFGQSRARRAPVDRSPGSHRPKITLARIQLDPRQFALNEPDETQAVREMEAAVDGELEVMA